MRNVRRNFKPKTLKQIKEYNTIIIENLDKIEKLDNLDIRDIHLIFNEGVLRYKPFNLPDIQYTYFTLKENKELYLEVYNYDPTKYIFEHAINARLKITKNDFNVSFESENINDPSIEEYSKFQISVTVSIMKYISEIEKNKQTIIKKTNRNRLTTNTSKNTHNLNNKKLPKQKYIALNQDKVIYQIECNDGIIKEHRKYLRHVDSWHVEGFYRHYKSGKVVWIEPQIRGTNKGKAKTQKYIIK